MKHTEAEANPRLLASAAEMLAALKTIHSFYTDLEKYPDVPVAELRQLIERVIAKATGGEE